MTFAKRLIAAALLCAIPLSVKAQVSSTGGEVQVTYTPPSITLFVNQPASNFSINTGSNTFIGSIAPTVSVRVAITNETSNPCLGVMQLSMASTSLSSATSLLSKPQAWQSVPLGQGLAANVPFDLPSLSTIYISSAAISATRIAIQIVNTTGGCSTTNMDAVATLTNVSITVPLISNTTGTLGIGANVQGVVPSGTNGFPVLPVETGALQPATNAGTATSGVDSSTTTLANITAGQVGNVILAQAPPPSKTTDLGFVAWTGFTPGGTSTGVSPPWACVTGFAACSVNSQNTSLAFVNNVSSGQRLVQNLGNGAGDTASVASVSFDMSNATIRQGSSGSGLTPAFGSNTLAGSTVLAVIQIFCTLPCTPAITSVVDTQSLVYNAVASNNRGTDSTTNRGLGVFILSASPTTAAADTVTVTLPGGMSINNIGIVELSNIVPANLNQPLIGNLADSSGRQVVVQDAVGANQQTCNVTLTTNTTTQCQGAPPAGLRWYITDFQINTTTAGTATTVSLKNGTGTNCGTGQTSPSAINYPNTTVAITNILGFRTPIGSPLGAAVCAAQAGTTPGTSVVEIHLFAAP